MQLHERTYVRSLYILPRAWLSMLTHFGWSGDAYTDRRYRRHSGGFSLMTRALTRICTTPPNTIYTQTNISLFSLH